MIDPRRKFRVVIRDSFNEDECDIRDIVEQLDPTEKNEVDVQRALRSQETVPVPEVEVVPDARWHRSDVHFEAPPRCFNYDSDYFAPRTYFADERDFQFIQKFNREHKFLKTSTADLERVFTVCEELVKDSLTANPTLDQVLLNLGGEGPPYVVAEAIFKHWQRRDKLGGSVIRWLDFPPEHCELRKGAIEAFRERSRKNLKVGEQLRHLFQNLAIIQQQREDAMALLEQTEQKQLANERFVREKQRQVAAKIKDTPAHAMVLETEIAKHDPAVPGKKAQDPNASAIPNPPSGTSFLSWCMAQKLPISS